MCEPDPLLMTRQHNALADALKEKRPAENWSASKKVQWNQDVQAVAEVCKRFTCGFEKQRFYDACGGLFEFEAVDTRQAANYGSDKDN